MAERIVEVEWEDSATTHGWQDADDADIQPWIIHTVGYVTRDDEKCIRLLESRGHRQDDRKANDHGCVMVIPRSAIRKVTELRRGKR